VEQAAMIHLPFWVAVDGLPFELELHDSRRFFAYGSP
jgi:hypothetical protein